jgi:hypothetical protein
MGFNLSDDWIKTFRSLDPNSQKIGFKLSDHWSKTFRSWSKNLRSLDPNFQIIGCKFLKHWFQSFLNFGSKLSDHWIPNFPIMDQNFQIIGSKPDLTDGDRQCYVLQTERSPPVMSCLLPPPLATSSLLSQARISFTFFSALCIRIRIDFCRRESDPDPGG